MKVGGRNVLLCSCEATMPVDAAAVAAALGGEPGPVHRQLCRSELSVFRQAVACGPVVVACGQEAPLFRELAQDVEMEAPLCVDIRDRAGWSIQADQAAAKMAALLADSMGPKPEGDSVLLNSAGRILVLGACDQALEVARRLAADRAVQLLLAPLAAQLTPPDERAFTLWRGRAVAAAGGLGNWTLTVEDLAAAKPSSRRHLEFEPARSGGSLLQADVVVDLSGDNSLVRARDGWIIADSRSALAVERAIHAAHDLLGEFEKPRYVTVDAALCAHARNGQVGCTRCLDVCPSGALVAKGDTVVVDAHACSGHGGCASVCPTGAIRFHRDPLDRVRTLLSVFQAGGGTDPVLLIHGPSMAPLSALARHGDGLPARVLPLSVTAVGSVGPDLMLAALALGAAEVTVLAEPGDFGPLVGTAEFVNRALTGLGGPARIRVIQGADPDLLVWPDHLSAPCPPADIHPGAKRLVMRQALDHLRGASSAAVDIVALGAGDPFGTIAVDIGRCTLCMACAVVCPSKAIVGNLRDLTLQIRESACTQCGLCRVACPEKAVGLVARLDWSAPDLALLKQDEPALCLSCGRPFAPKSSIERMVERLTGHSMFDQPGKLDLIRTCEDCRGKR
ncbi:MAG: 4Fe-4S binding protein [Alphaproteobacteria bacterium]|nr:4Fe-4S binding protein [Alphaproteobacteria bacterium]